MHLCMYMNSLIKQLPFKIPNAFNSCSLQEVISLTTVFATAMKPLPSPIQKRNAIAIIRLVEKPYMVERDRFQYFTTE